MKKISVVVRINPKNGKCNRSCYFFIIGKDPNDNNVSDCCISGEEVEHKVSKCPYSNYPEVKE